MIWLSLFCIIVAGGVAEKAWRDHRNSRRNVAVQIDRVCVYGWIPR